MSATDPADDFTAPSVYSYRKSSRLVGTGLVPIGIGWASANLIGSMTAENLAAADDGSLRTSPADVLWA